MVFTVGVAETGLNSSVICFFLKAALENLCYSGKRRKNKTMLRVSECARDLIVDVMKLMPDWPADS